MYSVACMFLRAYASNVKNMFTRDHVYIVDHSWLI